MFVAAPLIFVKFKMRSSVNYPPSFHSQMLFFVAPTYYRHLLTKIAGVWGCTQVSAALSRPIYGLNLLVLRYHFEFGFIFQEYAYGYPQRVKLVVVKAKIR
jgi:hypothetical protein